jgi:hypothetical protein
MAEADRSRILDVQAQELKYISHVASLVTDAKTAGMTVDREVHYALLTAATGMLDADARERELAATSASAKSMNRLTWVIALSTAVYAVATVVFYWRHW